MGRSSPGTAGRQGGLLLVAAGLFTLVNNYLPGSELLDVALLNAVGAIAVVAGAIAYVLPWQRWHPTTSLVLAALGFSLIAVSNRYGGVSAFSYAVYFVVVFVWVGIAHPPRTSWFLAPVAAFAYVLPLLLSPDPPPNAVSSVTVAIPVCVLVGETIARTVRRQALAQRALAERADLVESLATVVGELNADLDADAVLGRISHSARALLRASAAGFVMSDGETARIVAVDGVAGSLVGISWPLEGSSTGEVVRTREPMILTDMERYPYLMDLLRAEVPGLHTLLVIPSVGHGRVHGALYTLFAEPGRVLTADEVDVATLLASHAGAAVANAATHAEVVRTRDHEQAVIDGMADGMAVVGPDGTVVGWNAAAAELTGRPATEVVGGPLPFPVGPPRTPVDHHLPDGRWIEVLSSPLGDTGETVVGFRDVSKAKALDEAKDLFLATTSHELRTPITVIKGYVAILQRNWEKLSEADRATALASVAARTDSLVALVNHLLLGARAGAARYSMEMAAFDLEPAVRAAADGFRTVSDRHDVVVDVAPGLPPVCGDASSVDPLVGQLVENAIKYSPGGGEVRVEVRAGDGYATVDVLDRGVGIPEGAEEQLWTRFYQAGNGDRREYAGMGLGLHIVRQLVEAQGGAVHARNRDGGGARIGFTLPYAPVVPSARASDEVSPKRARTA
ncbi:MAG TPA: ATP-binding protein [Frankiaceae bacterium]|jgi:signal transduction histidine kinase|nr:ATP-binding protein [Frankiaceae bacterium]